MPVFFARSLDRTHSISTDLEPVFLEVEGGHLSLRARSVLHEVVRGGGRVVTHEPLHSDDRFELSDDHGHGAGAIESSSTGGLFGDRMDIVFAWPREIHPGDRFHLSSARVSVHFTAEVSR